MDKETKAERRELKNIFSTFPAIRRRLTDLRVTAPDDAIKILFDAVVTAENLLSDDIRFIDMYEVSKFLLEKEEELNADSYMIFVGIIYHILDCTMFPLVDDELDWDTYQYRYIDTLADDAYNFLKDKYFPDGEEKSCIVYKERHFVTTAAKNGFYELPKIAELTDEQRSCLPEMLFKHRKDKADTLRYKIAVCEYVGWLDALKTHGHKSGNAQATLLSDILSEPIDNVKKCINGINSNNKEPDNRFDISAYSKILKTHGLFKIR